MHPQLICYPLPSALWDGKENPPLSRNNVSTSKWIFWSRETGSFFLLQRVSCEGRGLTPLYILQVSLAGPRTTVEAQAFYRMVIFLRSNEKARLQATICGSADGLSLWNHSVSIILILDRKSTRLNSSHNVASRMPSSA